MQVLFKKLMNQNNNYPSIKCYNYLLNFTEFVIIKFIFVKLEETL